MGSLSSNQRSQVNRKFRKLNDSYALHSLWPASIVGEEEDLKLFLLTSPDLNDLQEFLQDKINDWVIAKESLKKGDSNVKVVDKLLAVYDLLIGFTDRLGDV